MTPVPRFCVWFCVWFEQERATNEVAGIITRHSLVHHEEEAGHDAPSGGEQRAGPGGRAVRAMSVLRRRSTSTHAGGNGDGTGESAPLLDTAHEGDSDDSETF
eukprot:m.246624 g.246624  ORF g.246624 m.246624 type:complete len:103 (-) comp15382_c0_seq2:260-568(-)